MIKLYFAPRTRASRPRWLLEELEVPYELVYLDMAAKDHKKPEYLKIHPHGLIPALEDGKTVLFESAAICMYLADKFPEKKMAPVVGTPERGLYYQWMAYCMTMLEPAAFTFFLHTIRLPEERRDPREVKDAQNKMQTYMEMLSKELAGKEFIIGNHFTAADVVLASLLNWANAIKMGGDFPVIHKYLDTMKARPAFKRSMA